MGYHKMELFKANYGSLDSPLTNTECLKSKVPKRTKKTSETAALPPKFIQKDYFWVHML